MTELHPEETAHPPRKNGANGHADVSKYLGGALTTQTFSMFRAAGDSGLKQSGGFITEEFLRELQGERAAKTFREMEDNSSAVGAALFAIRQTIRRVEWHAVSANEGNAEADDMTEFADELLEDMDETFEEFTTELLSMLTYGFAPMEIILKRRDDGRIGVRSLPLRGQDTVSKWDFDEQQQLRGLFQQPFAGPEVYLPRKKFLLFRPMHYKGNPEGRSVLRTSYRPWYFLKVLEEQQAILFSRLPGLPVVEIPSDIIRDALGGDAVAMAEMEAWKKLVTRTRVNDQMGVVIPSDMWPDQDGNPSTAQRYRFRFEVPQNRSQADYEAARKSYRNEILSNVLADFIELGHDARGTQALGVSKVDLFLAACVGWLKSAAATLNRELLPVIWAFNGFDPETMPEYVPELPRQADIDAQSAAILRLTQAGMPLFPDPETENVIRRDMGLPEAPEESIRAEQMALLHLAPADGGGTNGPNDSAGGPGA